jgi:deazaflavin-dependent oxidoreductase (nitroreductase family)
MSEVKSVGFTMDQIYPSKPLTRLLFKAPLLTWRLGLGPLVGKIILLLTTRGRKSGLPRHAMLEYYQHNGHKYAVSAFGEKSQWYRNIKADPRVTIQTAEGTEPATAIRVTDDEELLEIVEVFYAHDAPLTSWYLNSAGIEHNPESILANKDRLYFVRFESGDSGAPSGLDVDLAWIWPLALLALLLLPRRRR